MFFIIENNYYDLFYGGFTPADIESDILEGVVQTLLCAALIEKKDHQIIFSDVFKAELDNKGKGLLYLIYGYKDIIADFSLSQKNVYDFIDLSYVGKGTNLTDSEENYIYFSDYIKKNSEILSVADFGCGAGMLLFCLAQKYPNIQFYGIDINKQNIEKANLIAQKYKMNNIRFIGEDIKNIETIDVKEIDMIIGCYIFHQFPKEILENIISQCVEKWNARHLLLKECLIEKDQQYVDEKYTRNTFFLTYYLVHILSKQQLLSGEEWMEILEKQGFVVQNNDGGESKVFTFLASTRHEK